MNLVIFILILKQLIEIKILHLVETKVNYGIYQAKGSIHYYKERYLKIMVLKVMKYIR